MRMQLSGGLPLVCKLVKKVFPAVDAALDEWWRRAEPAPDTVLRMQALSSIEKKRFHCLGGGVFALYPGVDFSASVRFIVAFQTISDYLDNLCDRAGVFDEDAFRQLHLSMADAVDPDSGMRDYYSLYPHNDDGGYLDALVEACRAEVRKLPSLTIAQEKMKMLVRLYSELQALKHIAPAFREEKLKRWAYLLAAEYAGFSPWEFCAAAGSTLGVFLLFAAASQPGLMKVDSDAQLSAYFPWVSALHILLDYYIDAGEDRAGGDFNFTKYYRDARECGERLAFLAGHALALCCELGNPGFHKTVVRGLLALYLSDPKAADLDRDVSREILKSGGVQARIYYELCNLLRKAGKL
jgi:tetraprenyl-beta-curcumene synthase